MSVAEERVLAAVIRLGERGVSECCGLEIAQGVQRDRKEPVVVGYAFCRALGELVKSGRLESRWGTCCADQKLCGPEWAVLLPDGRRGLMRGVVSVGSALGCPVPGTGLWTCRRGSGPIAWFAVQMLGPPVSAARLVGVPRRGMVGHWDQVLSRC